MRTQLIKQVYTSTQYCEMGLELVGQFFFIVGKCLVTESTMPNHHEHPPFGRNYSSTFPPKNSGPYEGIKHLIIPAMKALFPEGFTWPWPWGGVGHDIKGIQASVGSPRNSGPKEPQVSIHVAIL